MKAEASTRKDFFKTNKVFFVTFFSLALYHLFFMLDSVTQTVNPVAYEFHAVDYSLGFCTKLLPGAIYHLLVGKYNEKAMTVYVRIISLLLILLLSILAQRIYSALSDYTKNSVLLFLVLCLACPCTFYYSLQFEGCLDAYWIILFLLCVLFAQNKILRWSIPLLVFLIVLVHEGAVLCYIPLTMLVLLLKAVCCEDKKEKAALFSVFALTVAVSVGAVGYFMLNNHVNVKVSDFEQLGKFFDSRNVTSRFYYEWYFFEASVDGGVHPDYFPDYLFSSSASPLVQLIFKVLRQMYYTVSTSDYIRPLPQILYSLPLFAAPCVVLIKVVKQHSEKKMVRLLAVCFLLLPLLSIFSGLAFSNDVQRWFSHALICLLGGVIAVSCFTGANCFSEIETLIRKHYPIIVPYLIGYPALMVK